ncbi:MAG: hypothetical protein ABR898_04550 [Terracidiphilus sp.]|jgi:hypothetical protein
MPKVLLSDQTVEFALRGPVLFAPGTLARSGSIVSQFGAEAARGDCSVLAQFGFPQV